MERATSFGYRVIVVDEMRRAISPLKDFRTYRHITKLLRELSPTSFTRTPAKAESSAGGRRTRRGARLSFTRFTGWRSPHRPRAR